MALLAAVMIAGFGCGDSKPLNSDVRVGESHALGTLGVAEDNQKVLMQGEWKTLDMDLKKYYYEIEDKVNSYNMKMKFSKYKVEALANCYKVEASYLLEEEQISFAKLSLRPAIEMASCHESENAEDAVDAFFSQSYRVVKKGDTMEFTSTTGQKIVLKR